MLSLLDSFDSQAAQKKVAEQVEKMAQNNALKTSEIHQFRARVRALVEVANRDATAKQKTVLNGAFNSANFLLQGDKESPYLVASKGTILTRVGEGIVMSNWGITRSLNKFPRDGIDITWPAEVENAGIVFRIQKAGRLPKVTRPLFDPSKTGSALQVICYELCLKDDEIAPNLHAALELKRIKFKGALNAWIESGTILSSLHREALLHGDFSIEQICVTDKHAVLVDLEAVIQLVKSATLGNRHGENAYLYHDPKAMGATKATYYRWADLLDERKATAVTLTKEELIRREAQAYALCMLEFLFGEIPAIGVTANAVLQRYPNYFSGVNPVLAKNIMTEIIKILFKLADQKQSVSFESAVIALALLSDQLPSP